MSDICSVEDCYRPVHGLGLCKRHWTQFNRKGTPYTTLERHGWLGTSTYGAWSNMKYRCYNKNSDDYTNYGKRGIEVCDRWLNSFVNFLEDMGACPDGFTLERINNDGNYEPSNCKWADRREQRRNQSNTRLNKDKIDLIFTLRREGLAQTKIAKEVGVSQAMVSLVLRKESYDDLTKEYERYSGYRNQYTMPE